MKNDPLGGSTPQPKRELQWASWPERRASAIAGADLGLAAVHETSVLSRFYYPAIWQIRHALLSRLARLECGVDEPEEVFLNDLIRIIERPWHLDGQIEPDPNAARNRNNGKGQSNSRGNRRVPYMENHMSDLAAQAQGRSPKGDDPVSS